MFLFYRHFVLVAPGFLEFKTVRSVEHVVRCGQAMPVGIEAEKKVQELVKKKERGKATT